MLKLGNNYIYKICPVITKHYSINITKHADYLESEVMFKTVPLASAKFKRHRMCMFLLNPNFSLKC